ncbi:MAG: hypothetical protein ABIP17_11445 [Ilumatobacteraceae bacterium]
MEAMQSRRTARLSVAAVAIGLAAGAAAWSLLHLIDLITNLTLFGRVGFDASSFADLSPSPRIVVVAALGALIIAVLGLVKLVI